MLIHGLSSTTASLATTSGGRLHKNVGILMSAPLYNTLTPTLYQIPVDPGCLPLQAGTAAVFDANKAHHTEAQCIFDNYHHMDGVLRTQIIDTVSNVYLSELQNK